MEEPYSFVVFLFIWLVFNHFAEIHPKFGMVLGALALLLYRFIDAVLQT